MYARQNKLHLGSLKVEFYCSVIEFHKYKTLKWFALRTVPTNSKVLFRGFLNMPEKQILTSVIEIQKENWG